ncbi:hypothetical protein SS50377_28585 [Spironucleus salmonicida]|uniref:Uncharacterized protein n=1 Tax=Spironucleus salmonicida TaxID=348837 RepID=V6LD35_9EUKA|nr:hypothetical protein SS50377_28585 [Spironucleus salmonicida]|eukprot:EST41591.1 Hypothetical protein SS50377_18932 [Spironucleus salmonicida]
MERTFWTSQELQTLEQHKLNLLIAAQILNRPIRACELKLQAIQDARKPAWLRHIDSDFSGIFQDLNRLTETRRPIYNVFLPTSGPGDDFFKQLDQMKYE